MTACIEHVTVTLAPTVVEHVTVSLEPPQVVIARIQDGVPLPISGPAGGDLTGNYPHPQIAAEVIVDGDVSPTAGIQQSKIQNLVTDLAGKEAVGTAAGLVADHEAETDPHPVYGRFVVSTTEPSTADLWLNPSEVA